MRNAANRRRERLFDISGIAHRYIHPAPLPEFQGWGVYNTAIVENISYWGASAHFMDEGFDTGPLIDQERFDVDMSRETCLSLEQRTQPAIATLFRRVFDAALRDRKLDSKPQTGGRYISKQDFLRLRQIQPDDSAELIERKIRAFWYPPHQGATISIGGKDYTVVGHEMMRSLGHEIFGSPDAVDSLVHAWATPFTE